MVPSQVYAQDNTDNDPLESEQVAPTAPETAPELVVIGTRRTDRSVTDSASPIDVIGATELGAQPAANMLDTVRNLVPSFFVPQNTISDASAFVRPPSLRGLGADQILVMINGKRYNRAALVQVYSGADTALSYGSQGADISNIPAIAVKNLQILRDGATAQYGSDAIGGVINYQIRDDEGFEAQALYGETYEGDGERWQFGLFGGVRLGDTGFVTVAAECYDEQGTSRGATRPSAVVFAQNNPSLAAQVPNFPVRRRSGARRRVTVTRFSSTPGSTSPIRSSSMRPETMLEAAPTRASTIVPRKPRPGWWLILARVVQERGRTGGMGRSTRSTQRRAPPAIQAARLKGS